MPKSERDTDLPGLVGLHRDAEFLMSDRRYHGALLLLLCVVDGLARDKYPSIPRNENKKRYCKYLRWIFAKDVWPDVWFNLVDPAGKCRMEEILYTFLRNPVVHEGATLDVAGDKEEPVRIDWESKGALMDAREGVLVFNAQKLVAFVKEVVFRGVGEGMGIEIKEEHRPDPLDTE